MQTDSIALQIVLFMPPWRDCSEAPKERNNFPDPQGNLCNHATAVGNVTPHILWNLRP